MTRFIARCAMRWSDMDAYGHINNTAYLSYLEQARVSMFFDRYDSSFTGGTVVAHHEITYLKPVVYHPQPLKIEMWIEKVGGASFTVRYEVYDDVVLAARAATALVTFDFVTNRPRRLSAEERVILLAYADEHGASDHGGSGHGADEHGASEHDASGHGCDERISLAAGAPDGATGDAQR